MQFALGFVAGAGVAVVLLVGWSVLAAAGWPEKE